MAVLVRMVETTLSTFPAQSDTAATAITIILYSYTIYQPRYNLKQKVNKNKIKAQLARLYSSFSLFRFLDLAQRHSRSNIEDPLVAVSMGGWMFH